MVTNGEERSVFHSQISPGTWVTARHNILNEDTSIAVAKDTEGFVRSAPDETWLNVEWHPFEHGPGLPHNVRQSDVLPSSRS